MSLKESLDLSERTTRSNVHQGLLPPPHPITASGNLIAAWVNSMKILSQFPQAVRCVLSLNFRVALQNYAPAGARSHIAFRDGHCGAHCPASEQTVEGHTPERDAGSVTGDTDLESSSGPRPASARTFPFGLGGRRTAQPRQAPPPTAPFPECPARTSAAPRPPRRRAPPPAPAAGPHIRVPTPASRPDSGTMVMAEGTAVLRRNRPGTKAQV